MKPDCSQKRHVRVNPPLNKNTMVLMEDIRWLLSHENCPSYPLILTVFAGIECLANMMFSNKKKSQNAQDFIDKYMIGYHSKLDCGEFLSKALYENLRSATAHHGGPRGGVIVSHEEAFKDGHLKLRVFNGKKYFVVHSRSLAQDFLEAAQNALEQFDTKSISTESIENGYKYVAVTLGGYQPQIIPSCGTRAE